MRYPPRIRLVRGGSGDFGPRGGRGGGPVGVAGPTRRSSSPARDARDRCVSCPAWSDDRFGDHRAIELAELPNVGESLRPLDSAASRGAGYSRGAVGDIDSVACLCDVALATCSTRRRSTGAGPATRLFRIALPSRLAALALAWLVAMAVALGDLAASVLVVPPGVTTLSIRLFGLLHYGVEDQVAGICLVQVVVFTAVAIVVGRIIRRKTWV